MYPIIFFFFASSVISERLREWKQARSRGRNRQRDK